MVPNTPLLDALLAHHQKKPVSFHVPGHKNGRIVPYAKETIFTSILNYDFTELPGLDDLHAPEGVIQEAQNLASSFYQSGHTFFLTGGSTSGNQAMIFSAFEKGAAVFVQRDAHVSVINGIRLAGLKPIFLMPAVEKTTGLSLGLEIQTVKRAYHLYPEAEGIVLTSPSYFGVSSSLRELISFVHDKGGLVLVDEAHGAHFAVNEYFPVSSLAEGADAVVHSAHKTLPAMTMGAYLHIGSNSRISFEAVQAACAVFQSSSPSYPIMASLDAARQYAVDQQQVSTEQWKQYFIQVKEDIQNIGFELYTPPSPYHKDPLKCIIRTPAGYTGWELASLLEEEGLYPELATMKTVLLILPLERTNWPEEWKNRASKALKRLQQKSPSKQRSSTVPLSPFLEKSITEGQVLPAVFRGKRQNKILAEAKSCTAASDIIPYPPGVPLFFKGEVLEGGRWDFLNEWIHQGGRVQGIYQHQGFWKVKTIMEDTYDL
ncbi:lysine decarboxylase [Sinobaca qinghaiensis]|uniref:Lysine decarboxylase n=1 Tax=Sinobaca qinghaiensis TaxID=342944 RepID=A0A419VUC7_9BACL|nr:aminotransferase class I/II-fold pyridoxal phosphate-dependent enzyme [Sinobaca qinghaiensis]RKD84177.1 lysine decarboxylase [Sinobaca qinghaiensis]